MTKKSIKSASLPATVDGEIDIRELFVVIWRRKWAVVVVTIVAALISFFVALNLPNIYRAEVLLAPTGSQESGGLAGLALQYGGLANIAGLDFGSGAVDKTELGIEVLKTRRFVGDFVLEHELLPKLIAARGWNSSDNDLEYDDDLYDEKTHRWVRQTGSPTEVVPSLQEAYVSFRKLLSIEQDSGSGLVRISIDHYSPYEAKQWVDWLVEDINAEIMRHDVNEAEKSIVYLRDQLQATSLSEIQEIFYQLIEEQTKTVMLANARPEYLFQTLDPAVVPERKISPKRTQIIIFGTFLGFFIAVLCFSILHFLGKNR